MPQRFLLVGNSPGSLLTFRRELLAALVAQGLEVHAAAPALTGDTKTCAVLAQIGVQAHDFPLQRTGTNPASDVKTLAGLYRLMRRVRPDTVLAYTIKPVIYGTVAAWLARVPRRFALICGLGFAFTDGRDGVVFRLVRSLYAFALSRVSKVFFQNPDDAALFRELGLVPQRVPIVVVNGSGVDLDRFGQAPLPAGAPSFVMICRLLGDKGVREYAAAARRIRAERPDVRFALAGGLDENPACIAQAELDGWVADDTLDYLGKLDDVRPAYAACSVYVLPSYREGTPRTVLEAMSAGRAIITTDAPGCRETVVEGENGFLVPVKSVDALVAAMQKFIDDPALAPKMGQASRRIAEGKYDVHKVNAVMLREMDFNR